MTVDVNSDEEGLIFSCLVQNRMTKNWIPCRFYRPLHAVSFIVSCIDIRQDDIAPALLISNILLNHSLTVGCTPVSTIKLSQVRVNFSLKITCLDMEE